MKNTENQHYTKENLLKLLKQLNPDIKEMAFLNKYFTEINKPNELELFNKISSITTMVNKNLKLICQELNIDKQVSSHVARHTFANLLDKVVTDKRHISKALGHSKFSMTENYLADLAHDEIDISIDILYI